MTQKRPKKDGSGRGVRLNRGRAGCTDTEPIGLGMNRDPFAQYKQYWRNWKARMRNRYNR